MELARNQVEYVESVIAGAEIVPSTNPSLFLAAREIIMDRFHELKPIPPKGVEIRTELGLSDEAMKYGFDESIADDVFGSGCDIMNWNWWSKKKKKEETDTNFKELNKELRIEMEIERKDKRNHRMNEEQIIFSDTMLHELSKDWNGEELRRTIIHFFIN